MKKCEEDRNYHDDMHMERRLKKKIYYRKPITKAVKLVTVSVSMGSTLEQVAEVAYKKANIEDLVDFEQCRIVTYLPNYDIVESTPAQDVKLENLYSHHRMSVEEFLLEIRDGDKFEEYPPEVIVTKVLHILNGIHVFVSR